MKKIAAIFLSILIFSTVSVSINKAEVCQTTINSSELPSSFTWCNIDGVDYVGSIKDQSPAPTCEAYALCTALETIMQYQLGYVYDPDLSETHLYFNAGGTYEKGYVNLIDAANYLIENGVPDEGCYPDPHRAYDYPFITLDGWENRTVKITEWGWVENTEESIKSALIEYGPLVFCAFFWKDFYSYKQGIYKHRLGEIVGGHVMAIVGYNDSEECWIVKNSWGTKWGDDGWLKISYDAGMITDTWYKAEDDNCTGIMYLDGIYGNLQPDVPKIYITHPKIKHTYFFGREFFTIFKKSNFLTEATPRIFGDIEINVSVENADKVEFYIDGIKSYVYYEPPYTLDLDVVRGRHTLKVVASNENYSSMDILDFYKII